MKAATAKWSSWSELEESYRLTALALKEARAKLIHNYDGNNGSFWSDKENLGSMAADVTEIARILKEKVLYEFSSLSEDELALLTDRQREIAELRQRYNYREIAEILGISPKTVFDVFQKAVRNVKKIKRQGEKGLPVGLSPQQEQIYILFWIKHRTKNEIAEIMQLSCNSVKTQIKRIKAKIGVTRAQEN